MRLLSQDGWRYYTRAWRREDVVSFLTDAKLEKGEPVGIYSSPSDGPHPIEFEDLTLRRIANLGYEPATKPDSKQLESRVWAESWRRFAELIREFGGTPVVILFADRYKDPEMTRQLAERLNVELISVEEWRKRGGKWQGQ